MEQFERKIVDLRKMKLYIYGQVLEQSAISIPSGRGLVVERLLMPEKLYVRDREVKYLSYAVRSMLWRMAP